MTTSPLVSVVLPCYNHEKFVAQAIGSVFEQSYTPLELIIVDDGSGDSSCAEIERTLSKYQGRKDVSVRFFRNENAGAHAALNFGLAKAQGEFLTLLNSD